MNTNKTQISTALYILMVVVVFSLFTFSAVSCGGRVNKHEVSRDSQTGVYYTCTMHPEVKSDKPGKCPKCGMELVKEEGMSADSTGKTSPADSSMKN